MLRKRYIRMGCEPKYGSLKRLWHWHLFSLCFFFCVGDGWISFSFDPDGMRT